MNNIDKSPKSENTEQQVDSSISKRKAQSIFQELEVLSMQKGLKDNIDLSKFSPKQIDKLLETLSENEKNAFNFHSKRIDAIKEIELSKISASTVNQKTLRIAIIGLLLALPLITLLILFYKENFFIPWLTFLTGLLGGIGLSKILPAAFRSREKPNPILEDEKRE